MTYLVKDGKLELKYESGKGAWTYHIQIPNTKHIIGKWGDLKVSGFIDGYKLEAKNLFTIKGQDKLISINQEIRAAINKGGGDTVTVTLYLLTTNEPITEKQILETFKESEVLESFEQLPAKERNGILGNVLSERNEEKQIKLLVRYIDELGKLS